MIYDTTLITSTDEDEFIDQLNAMITRYQANGLLVKVQFSTDVAGQTGLFTRFSALVVATRQGTWPT